MKMLVADLGGSNCRFALADTEELSVQEWLTRGQASFHKAIVLPTNSFPSARKLLAHVCDFYGDELAECTCGVLAVAGPAHGDGILAPNMGAQGCLFSLKDCQLCLGIEDIRLINDFTAQALASLYLFASRPQEVFTGCNMLGPEQRFAVIGAGTGLGMCLLLKDATGAVYSIPSEGGHTGVLMEPADEAGFMEFACKDFAVPWMTWDKLLGGRGLSLLHQYVFQEKLSPAEVAGRFTKDSPVLEIYARLYGRACRNYVLYTTAWSGLYVTGGIVMKNPCILQHPSFLQSFQAGPGAEYLRHVPVLRYTVEEAGLWGAVAYIAQHGI